MVPLAVSMPRLIASALEIKQLFASSAPLRRIIRELIQATTPGGRMEIPAVDRVGDTPEHVAAMTGEYAKIAIAGI